MGRKPAPAATQTANARPGGLERGALLAGLAALVLGLVLRLVAAASFVTLIQALFYVAAFALALWFVLLLLRASQER